MKRRVLPGFRLSLGITLVYAAIIILLPLSALIFKAASLGPSDYWRIVSSDRAVASYGVTVGSALIATLFNLVFGLALAWVLVRYRFPGKKIVDALVDLPFALPTAVAGISLTALLAGWLAQWAASGASAGALGPTRGGHRRHRRGAGERRGDRREHHADGDRVNTTPNPTSAAVPAAEPRWSVATLWQSYGTLGILVLLVMICSAISPQYFLTTDNLVQVLLQSSVMILLACGVFFTILIAGIDLSVGVLMTFTAVMAGVFMTNWGWPMIVGVPATIAMGALVGATSGLIITQLKVTPFIATLGMMMLLKGASLLITEAKPIYFSDVEGFDAISLGSVVEKVLPFLPIPNGSLIFLAVAVVSAFLLKKTALGRYTFALGSNEEAVRLSGVNTNRWKVIVYTLCGAICSFSGLLVASRLNSAQPALGQGYELDAIAAVVIGGTSLSGGIGTILGTVIGAFIMSVLINGLRIMSVAQEWQMVLTGLIIIAVILVARGKPRDAR